MRSSGTHPLKTLNTQPTGHVGNNASMKCSEPRNRKTPNIRISNFDIVNYLKNQSNVKRPKFNLKLKISCNPSSHL
jgi:hypothetical protein